VEIKRDFRSYAALSPYELKDELVCYAKDDSPRKAATHEFLDAGRGNPNWLAIPPRQAFFALGDFALRESHRASGAPGVGGVPRATGVAQRLHEHLDDRPPSHGATLLRKAVSWTSEELHVDADAVVHEWVDGVLGDSYPYPDRMLEHSEQVVRRYLTRELLGDAAPSSELDLFAVEGSTAGVCYLFRSLFANGLLQRGDTIALGTPLLTSYLQLPQREEFQLEVVEVAQSAHTSDGRHSWQYSERELDKLLDPRIKAFFLVNPSNPASFGMAASSRAHLQSLVDTRRPDLIILSDDVYGTFVSGFRSLAHALPHNTVVVYSFSKYFGCTGWRLGVIALHADNVIDRLLQGQSEALRDRGKRRYRSISAMPERLRFIDRLVADSRDVALNHTAGLSTPQQVQMSLFALSSLLDENHDYQATCRELIQTRLARLQRGLGVELVHDPLRAGYYVTLDLAAWGSQIAGRAFVDYVRAHREPIEIVLNLARKHGSVLRHGNGSDAPRWSVQISLANLDAQDCESLGRDLAELCRSALADWQRKA
jgi:aspartate 4-decarboxylase